MTYNHAYTIAFSVRGSTDPQGEDLTQEQIAAAIHKRVGDLLKNNEMLEAIGLPCDSYEEQVKKDRYVIQMAKTIVVDVEADSKEEAIELCQDNDWLEDSWYHAEPECTILEAGEYETNA